MFWGPDFFESLYTCKYEEGRVYIYIYMCTYVQPMGTALQMRTMSSSGV